MKRFPVLTALILSLASASHARAVAPRSAQEYDPGIFRLSSPRTSDSSVLIQAKLPSAIHSLLFTIAQDDAQTNAEQLLLTPEHPDWSVRLYLRRGPGTYVIRAFDCTQSRDACIHLQRLEIVNTDQRDNSFALPTAEIQSDAPELISLAHSLTDGLQSELEKSRAIHRWITSTIAYDTVAYFGNTYQNMSWDALTTLHRKSAICQGYSNLSAALHRAIGMRAKVISGMADSVFSGEPSSDAQKLQCTDKPDHAWNEVLIGGKWLPQDATWDAGVVDFDAKKFSFSPRQTYFDESPEEFSATHLKCSEYAS